MSNYEISKSSLLSLKAEILRKQEDLAKNKAENVEKIKTIKKKTPLELKNKGVEDRRQNDLDEEEQDLLKLSKFKLEAKARLYEKLSGISSQNEELNRRYLVRFDKKNKVGDQPPSDSEDVPDTLVVSEDEERHFSDEYDEAVEPSEQWVEYIDGLGRTRKCLRKDLEYLKSKDPNLVLEKSEKEIEVSHDLEDGHKEENTKCDQDIQSEISSKESELISGDVRREMLRQQWEKEEEALRSKADIHYQNVLFNEARQHGVGYYSFSKDEEERAKQQEALKKLREETEQQQKKAQNLKNLREKQMAVRMKAARKRRRARLGLPPEEEEDDPIPSADPKPESQEEEKKKQEEQRAAEETEKLLMEARKRHVRPWDIGKDGVSEHYEMTQDEWNEKKRRERIEEFAPPKSYPTREFSSMQSLEDNFEENDKSLKFSTKKNTKNKWKSGGKHTKVQPLRTKSDNGKETLSYNYEEKSEEDRPPSPSSATLRGLNPYKNFYYDPTNPTSDTEVDDNLLSDYKISKTNIRTINPTLIVNELEDIDFDDRLLRDYNRATQGIHSREEEIVNIEDISRKRGVEIAPPPTFEYYGPGEGKRIKTSAGHADIADSIEAGLKFLRKKAERTGKHCVDDM